MDQPCHVLDLVADLLRRHENVGVVLGKAADAHQAVELAGFFMAVDDAQLTHPQGQIAVGARFGGVDENAAGTVHRFDGVVFLVDDRRVHVVFIVIPVAGGLPELPV